MDIETKPQEESARQPELTPTEKAKRRQWHIKHRKEEIEVLELEVRLLTLQIQYHNLTQQIEDINREFASKPPMEELSNANVPVDASNQDNPQ